ncbi:MAG: S9 family peptidase [Bacteroidales bacterium]|nr:S9 family peptidase [Bacteroidales bacterium]
MMTSSCRINDEVQAPDAKKIKKELKIHNDIRIDNYYWLRDKDNPEVIKYLEDENKYTEQCLQHTEDLQEVIFDEITSRIRARDRSVPYKDNGYYYYHRYEDGKEHPIYCRKKNDLNNREEVLLDVNEMSEGYPYFHISDFSISDNNKFMAFSVDTLGNLKYELRFKDLETGEVLNDRISDTDGESEWASDNKTVFYIKKDETTHREYQLWKHITGTFVGDDKLIYEEKDESFYISVFKSKSDKIIFLGSYNTISTEYRFLPTDKPDDDFKLLIPRQKNHEYFAAAHGKDLFILTNYADAPNFKIVKSDINNPDINSWKEIVPHNKDIFIEDFEVFKDYLVVNERKNGLVYLKIINLKDNSEHYLECKEDVHEIWISDNDEYDSEILRYGYSSLTTPSSYFDYNMRTKENVLLKQKYAGNDFNSDDYKSERLYAKSNNGVKIPISIVYRKGIVLNGENPLLIYAYGSYGYSSDTNFQPSILSLLNRGFVFAVAHVRGGQELGRSWYEDGKLLKKKNTFNDFITCTEFLHQLNWSKPEKTFATGASAGGLLTGAVSNMRPDLYAGIISEVPFVDPVTTMLDETIPLTTEEYEEWGNPADKEYYDYMLSYSPYDQVKKQDYPAMFITAGINDSQVQYWEPAKWTAKLRDYNTGYRPIYFHTTMDAGHSGMSGRYKTYKETAMIYAFILDVLGDE